MGQNTRRRAACAAPLPVMDPKIDHHTQKAISCFEIMNVELHQDILDVGVHPAQFLTNDKVLARIKLRDKVSPRLQYACTHWAKLLRKAEKSNKHLVKELETFVNEHLLHWIEVLSWISELDSANSSLQDGIALLELDPTFSNFSKLLSEGQQLISNFGDLIKQTALHTYRTPLHLLPNESLLYKTYSKEKENNLSRVLSRWPNDSHRIITRSQHKHPVNHVLFSGFYQTSTYFASWIVNVRDSTTIVNMWDSTTGMICGSIDDERIALSHNFRMGASSQGSSVFLYTFLEGTPKKQFTASAPVLRIALSFDGSRLAAGSSDGKVKLWNGVDGSLILDIEGFECRNQEYCQFVFSPQETASARLAFSSVHGGLEFRKASNGERIINTNYPSTMHFNLVFSHDGSRLASLVKGNDERRVLTVWDIANDTLVGKSPGSVGSVLAISADGAHTATTGEDGHQLQLWSQEPGDTFQHTSPNLNSWDRISYLAFSQGDILLIGFAYTDSVLYNFQQRSIIAKIPKHNPLTASFSLDCTRLAIGYPDGTLDLWDFRSFEEPPDAGLVSVTILAFSPDYSRLASGFEDGTILLWDTECPSQPLAVHKSHSAKVTALAFRLDGLSFVSGAVDGTIRMWDSDGDVVTDLFQLPTIGELTSLAFSGFVLAAATVYETNLWDIRTGINGLLPGSTLLSFSNPNHDLDSHSHLLLLFNEHYKGIRVWDILANQCIARSQLNTDIQTVEKMAFTSDNSQLAGTVRLNDGSESFCLFDLANKLFRYLQADEYTRLFPMPHWYKIPVWLQYSGGDYIITGSFSEDNDRRPIDLKMVVLPNNLVVNSCKPCGSRMFALPSRDGRILLLKPLN